ncbi:hypothetical protein [Actinoplanes sp. NPDC049265]|uniref:hypothetical protein n=1 Tax=Actinoplanes sp. NPDC049265 TaxID=3363902 RepID=UPI00372451FB
MTAITSISASSAAAAYRVAPAPPVRRDPMAAVADSPGPGRDDSRDEVGSGDRLTDLATAKGVSRTELIDALKAGLPAGAVNAGLRDPEKLGRVSDLLDLPASEVAAQAGTATDLVTMLQNRGLDVGQLRNVMSSGDLLDVRA